MSELLTVPPPPLLISPGVRAVFERHSKEGTIDDCLNNAIHVLYRYNGALLSEINLQAMLRPELPIDETKPEQVGSADAIFRWGAYGAYMGLDVEANGQLPVPSKAMIEIILGAALPARKSGEEWHPLVEEDDNLQAVLELSVPAGLTDSPEEKAILWSGAGLVRHIFVDYIKRYNN